MVVKYTILREFLGFDPDKNETVLIDGNYWIIDHFYGDDVYLAEAAPIAL
jgi:hypothetical protein